jgi:protein translocase SecG subunit
MGVKIIMLKIIILILGVVITILSLLQEDNNDGVMSLTNVNSVSLFSKPKAREGQKWLEIATWVCTVLLFVAMIVNQVA